MRERKQASLIRRRGIILSWICSFLPFIWPSNSRYGFYHFEFLITGTLCNDRCFPHLKERHHYTKVDHYASRTLEKVRKHDELKRDLAKQKGITLTVVPCWWDYRTER